MAAWSTTGCTATRLHGCTAVWHSGVRYLALRPVSRPASSTGRTAHYTFRDLLPPCRRRCTARYSSQEPCTAGPRPTVPVSPSHRIPTAFPPHCHRIHHAIPSLLATDESSRQHGQPCTRDRLAAASTPCSTQRYLPSAVQVAPRRALPSTSGPCAQPRADT